MLLACLCIAASAAATEPAKQSPNSEDIIIVTGERVPRTLRDTASSVDVTTADRIEAMSGADRIQQVLEQVPNVRVGSGGAPVIRGQDTTGVLQALPFFLGGARPRTTLQVDGRAVSYNEFIFATAGLWDLERVEVFRTPQTTTQGQNSIAGAIFIHSKDPTYDWEARARGLLGNYRMRQVSAAVSGPIVNDQLAFRAVADVRRGLPSVESGGNIRGADPNSDDYSLVRFKLLGQPRFWAGSRIELTYAHFESLMPGGDSVRQPFRERRNPNGIPTFGTDVDSVTAVVEHPIRRDLRASTTLSYGNAHVRRFSSPGLGESDTHSNDFSAEAVLDWNPQGPVKLVVGASHRRQSLDQLIDLSAAVGIGEFDDLQRSYGVFGELSLEPLARTTMTVGLRYQHDRQRRSGAVTTPLGPIPLTFDGRFAAWLPKLSVAYDFNGDVRAGVLIQRAHNPGGTTLRLDTGQLENFGAERLWNYELFARGGFAGGRLNLAGNLFYTAFQDAQRFRSFLVGPLGLAEIYNVPKARTYGAELTIDWVPSDRLSMRAAFGFLDTKITRTDAESQFFQDKEFARSPGFTASGGIDWRPMEPVQLSAQLRHHGSYFSNDRETESLRIKPATFVDTRAAWTAGPVTLFGYVRNLFDTFRLRFLLEPTRLTNPPTAAGAHDPREFGVGIESRF